MSDIIQLIETPYRTIDDVVAGLTTLERVFLERRDRRAVFASAYLGITLAVKRQAEAGGFFEDDAWVRGYDVAFGNLYRQALLDFERGNHAVVPKSWRFSFETAITGDALVFQDLLLGINAHINHDLALALVEVGIEPRDRCFRDHTKVNEALAAATDDLQDRVARLYAPALRMMDQVAGRLDEDLAGFSVQKARQACWDAAVLLAGARTDAERSAVHRRMDDASAVLARLILSSVPAGTVFARTLAELERQVPWWELLEVPGGGGDLPPAPVVPEHPAVGSVDELIARLEETVARYDAAKSRMSIYPSAYLLVTRRFKDALENGGGGFEDRAWVERVERHFATRFLLALEAHEAGRAADVPDCWKTTFAAAMGGKTTLVQDIALAVNARLNHDLPLALMMAGISDDRERRRRDLEAFHALFKASIDPVQEMVAAKYSPFLRVLDVMGLRLDEMAADFSYRRARDAAWDNAVRLADSPSGDERRMLLREIDRRTTVLANRILLRGIIGGDWVARALRAVEDRFQGRWSEWVAPSA